MKEREREKCLKSVRRKCYLSIFRKKTKNKKREKNSYDIGKIDLMNPYLIGSGGGCDRGFNRINKR